MKSYIAVVCNLQKDLIITDVVMILLAFNSRKFLLLHLCKVYIVLGMCTGPIWRLQLVLKLLAPYGKEKTKQMPVLAF